jgi:hypothetical protein
VSSSKRRPASLGEAGFQFLLKGENALSLFTLR